MEKNENMYGDAPYGQPYGQQQPNQMQGYPPQQQQQYPPQQQQYPPQQQPYPQQYPQQPYPAQQQQQQYPYPYPDQTSQQTTVVVVRFGEVPQQMQCPYCHHQGVTRTQYQTGSMTWMACGGVMLLGCVLPCLWLGPCLIPFCMDSMKDVKHDCPNCGKTVGYYRRAGA